MTKTATKTARILTALLGGSLVAGCQGGQIDEVAVTHGASLAVEANLNAMAGGLSFTTESSSTFSKALQGSGVSVNTDVASLMDGLSMPLMRGMVGPDMTQMIAGTGMPSMMTTEERTAESAAKLRRFMDERLFVPENLESKDGENATYLLHADPTCRPLAEPGAALPPIDQKCAQDLAAVNVRMKVEDHGGSTTLRIQMGPERFELVSFVVSNNRIALDCDLSQSVKALVYANAQTNPGSADPTHGATVAGKVELYVQKDGPRKASAGISLLEGLRVQAPQDNDLVLTVAPSAPVFSVQGDGDAKTASATWDLRAVEYSMTRQNTGEPVHHDHMKMGGVGGTLAVSEGSRTLQLRNVHLLDTGADRDGASIISVMFNSSNNHALDSDVTVGTDDVVHVSVRPGAELKVTVDSRPLANTDADRANASVQTVSVSLADPTKSTAFDVLPSKLQITQGTLVLQSSGSTPEKTGTLTVAAGQCLVDGGSDAPSASPASPSSPPPVAPPASSGPFSPLVVSNCQ